MRVERSAIPDVLIVEPRVFGDARGIFFESWNRRTLAGLGLDVEFVQDNHSRSTRGVLRGLHYQVQHAQGKLVRVVTGEVYDVAVDLRRSSPTFGKWVGAELSETNHHMLYVPAGFAHGFLALTPDVDFLYKCTDFYAPQHERTIRWDDPEVGIEWPLPRGVPPIVAARDAAAGGLADVECLP